MDQPPPLLTGNDQIGSINNEYDYYSNGLFQQEDTFQQNPCSCNNCLSNASNFQLPYDNDSSNYMNISESPPPLMQLQQQHNIEQTSPIISPTVEQCINNDQQFIAEHVQPQSIPNTSSSPSHSPHNNNNNNNLNPLSPRPHSPNNNNNLSVNNNTSSTIIENDSQTSFTELFRIEISGVEIIFRKKILLNSNHNLETRNSPSYIEQSPGIRTGRIQYRVHPYQVPAAENCRYNKINYRNPIYPNNYPNYIPKQYYPHFTPQLNPQIIDSYQ